MSTQYQDFSLNFNRHPITGDISLVTDEMSVSQSIRNLILTDKYEVPFLPKQAGHIRGLLFELATPFTSMDASTRIKEVIHNYEPRATLLNVDVKLLSDNNSMRVTIVYRTKTSYDDVILEFYLDRIT